MEKEPREMEVMTKLNNLKQEYIIITQTPALQDDMNHNHNHLKQSKLQDKPKNQIARQKTNKSINLKMPKRKNILVSKNPLKQTYLVLVNSI